MYIMPVDVPLIIVICNSEFSCKMEFIAAVGTWASKLNNISYSFVGRNFICDFPCNIILIIVFFPTVFAIAFFYSGSDHCSPKHTCQENHKPYEADK